MKVVKPKEAYTSNGQLNKLLLFEKGKGSHLDCPVERSFEL